MVIFLSIGCSTAPVQPVSPEAAIISAHTQNLHKDNTDSAKSKSKPDQIAGSLSGEIAVSDIYHLQHVKLTGYTGLYDSDKDGSIDRLNVYFQPMDQDGDIIKAAGKVEIELWNLNTKPDKALVGHWQISPLELRKKWYASILTINYRVSFELPDSVSALKTSLTVKISFTDLLSGELFRDQCVAVKH